MSESNNKNNVDFYAFNYLRGKLTKWRIISLILFLIILFQVFKKFNNFNNNNENNNSINDVKKDFIAKIEIDRPIIHGEDFSIPDLIETLKQIEQKDQVKGLLLEINSPGGGVVDSFDVYDAIISFKEKTKKPVVTLIKDLGASGAYLISVSGDQIFANNASIVGSVGTIAQFIDLTELASKIGIKMNSFRSGPLKALPNQFEKSNQEADSMMRDIINDLNDQFLGFVKKNRKSISAENFKRIEKAGVFTGREAKEIGLVDQIGGEKEISEWFTKTNNAEYEIIKIEYGKTKKFDILKDILKRNKASIFDTFKENHELQQIKSKVFKRSGFYFMSDTFN